MPTRISNDFAKIVLLIIFRHSIVCSPEGPKNAPKYTFETQKLKKKIVDKSHLHIASILSPVPTEVLQMSMVMGYICIANSLTVYIHDERRTAAADLWTMLLSPFIGLYTTQLECSVFSGRINVLIIAAIFACSRYRPSRRCNAARCSVVVMVPNGAPTHITVAF